MGFSISQIYSRFITAEEIDKPYDLTIKDVKQEEIYSMKTHKKEKTLVVYFEKTQRGVCLSKTRATDIKKIYGDNTDNWIGNDLCMYRNKEKHFGKEMEIIRFKKPINKKELSKELDNIATSQE